MSFRVVHYINQFFAQIGGEEMAHIAPELRDGAVGPGAALLANWKGEAEIVDYMKKLRMSVFVSDYDHNAPNPEHLRNTHEPLYRAIRSEHPDIPYIFMSLPDAYAGSVGRLNSRRDVIYETFMKARRDGDDNVYFIDGESLFRGPYEDICYADSTHPTDMGFAFMADAVTSVINKALFRDRIEK